MKPRETDPPEPTEPEKSAYQAGQLPFFKSLVEIYALENIFQAAFTLQRLTSEVGLDFPNLQAVGKSVQEEFNELHDELVKLPVEKTVEKSEQNPPLQNPPLGIDSIEEEIGDCFFSLINLCRHLKIHPEDMLDRSVKKFLARCSLIEEFLKQEGKTLPEASSAELDTLWRQAKIYLQQNPNELTERLRREALLTLGTKGLPGSKRTS